MFGFLSPVKPQVFFASLWLALAGVVEVLSTRQSGIAVDCIRLIHSAAQRPDSGTGSGAAAASRCG